MWQVLLLLSGFSVAISNESSRVSFFWQANEDILQTKSDYEYVYQQWKASAHPGYLMGGTAYIMDMDTGKLEYVGASGQRVEEIGFSVWKEMGLKVSANIFIYDYKLSSPSSFIQSAIEKMKKFSLDGFHLTYRPTPATISNQTNLNSFMDFLDLFGSAMHQVNPKSVLSLSGGQCPTWGQFSCASAGSVAFSGYMDESNLDATTAERFKAIESQDQALGEKYWPYFLVMESLGESNWSGLLNYLGQKKYSTIGSMSPKNVGLQPDWYLDGIVSWLNEKQ